MCFFRFMTWRYRLGRAWPLPGPLGTLLEDLGLVSDLERDSGFLLHTWKEGRSTQAVGEVFVGNPVHKFE